MSILGMEKCIHNVDILRYCSLSDTVLHRMQNFCVIFITYISLLKDKLPFEMNDDKQKGQMSLNYRGKKCIVVYVTVFTLVGSLQILKFML